MKTTAESKELILQEVRLLYRNEKDLSFLLNCLKRQSFEESNGSFLKQKLEENKSQCERLEGILAVLHEEPVFNSDETLLNVLDRALSFVPVEKYQKAIYTAEALGYPVIARLLKRAYFKKKECSLISIWLKKQVLVAA